MTISRRFLGQISFKRDPDQEEPPDLRILSGGLNAAAITNEEAK